MIIHQQRRQFGRRPSGLAAPLAVGLAAASCMLALAACGSSGNSSRAVASVNPQVAFAVCMRAHGVPSFPDSANIPDALSQSPAFTDARQACRGKLYQGRGPHGLSESTRLSLLRHAQCMRGHGVPDYPDPNFPSHGPYQFGPPPGFNTSTPAFTRAAAACGSP